MLVLKVIGTPGSEYVLAGVEQYFRVNGINMEGFNVWVEARSAPGDCDQIVHAQLANGKEVHILANSGSVFVMNENGKTIDKF